MLIKGNVQSINISIKAEQILNNYDTIQSLHYLLVKSGYKTSNQLFNFLETYFLYAENEVQKKIILIMIDISNKYLLTTEKTINCFLYFTKEDLKLLLQSKLVINFLIKNFEILRSDYYHLNELINNASFETIDENLEHFKKIQIKEDKLNHLINLIISESFRNIYNRISNTSLDYIKGIKFEDYVKENQFRLHFQMNTQYNAIHYNDWLGGNERNSHLDKLFRNSFMKELKSEEEFYSYDNNFSLYSCIKLVDPSFSTLRSKNRYYDIEVEGKSIAKIIFGKIIDFNKINSLSATLKELQEDIDFFSLKYTNLLNRIKAMNKNIRTSFDKIVGEAYLKYPKLLDNMDSENLKNIVNDLRKSNKTLIEYLKYLNY
jgi:hypothetical protein